MKTEILIITIFLTSFIMGIASAPSSTYADFYNNAVSVDNTQTDNANSMASDDSMWGKVTSYTTQLWDSTIGNAVKWGIVIWQVLWRGLIPFSNLITTDLSPIGYMIAGIIAIIRTIMSTIVAVKSYQLFKNKGTF